MRIRHTGEKSLQALAKQNLLKGASTGKLKFCEHCIIGKKNRVRFDTVTYYTKGIMNYVHGCLGTYQDGICWR